VFFVFYFLFLIFDLSWASAKAYDGLWFMGLNFDNALFKDLPVRQAIQHCIDKEHIANTIMSEEAVPVSFIPPGMLGYDPDLKPYKRNIGFAKLLMKRAGHPLNDKSLKNLSLLHTDGIKTEAIAKQIQKDLKEIGIKASLTRISYKDSDKWVEELNSGKHDFFLMGYKAGYEQLFSEEATSQTIDSYSLVEPLFGTYGEANFTGYSNTEIDKLLEQLKGLDMALKTERQARLKTINKILYKDLPAVILFYIEKL
jgi:ABC-type transport system substrate-binding protein